MKVGYQVEKIPIILIINYLIMKRVFYNLYLDSPLKLSENAEKALKCWDLGLSNNPHILEFYNEKSK